MVKVLCRMYLKDGSAKVAKFGIVIKINFVNYHGFPNNAINMIDCSKKGANLTIRGLLNVDKPEE